MMVGFRVKSHRGALRAMSSAMFVISFVKSNYMMVVFRIGDNAMLSMFVQPT